MSVQRFYFETEETKVTKTKGWVDAETDYTQIYLCFNKISPDINSATTFKLLFYLLAYKMNKSNGIECGLSSFNDFNDHLGLNRAITYRTYMNCMKELKDANALTQVSKGHYYANPDIFWKDDTKKRVAFIVEERKFNTDKPLLLGEPTNLKTIEHATDK